MVWKVKNEAQVSIKVNIGVLESADRIGIAVSCLKKMSPMAQFGIMGAPHFVFLFFIIFYT